MPGDQADRGQAVRYAILSASETVVDRATEINPRLQRYPPRYMLPDDYVPLKSMPPASNSKRDCRKLQQLGAAYDMEKQQTREIIGPANATEATLCQIWAEVLRCPLDDISTEDHFLSLGGDSVSAMRIRSCCRQIGFHVRMADILRLATVKKISGTIDSRKTSSKVQLSSASDGDVACGKAFELSPIQQFYFEVEHSKETGFVMGRLLSIPKAFSPESICDALYTLVSRHNMLRAHFEQDKTTGQWSQHISASRTDSLMIQYINMTAGETLHTSRLSCIDTIDIENVDLITAALMHSFHQTFPDRNVPPCFNIVMGRHTCKPGEDGHHMDMSDTIGWFSTIVPVQMSTPAYAELGAAIGEAKAQAVCKLPDQGAAYFLSRYYHHEKGQRALANGKPDSSGSHGELYEVQLNYQAGFSPRHTSDDDESLSPWSTSASNGMERQPTVPSGNGHQSHGKIQQLPLPASLERTMASRFIPWSVFSITVPPLARSQDG